MKRLGWRARLHLCFPHPSLKFRTLGFPQYGFKPGVKHDLRPEGLYVPQAGVSSPVALPGKRSDPIPRHPGPEALRSEEGYVVPPPQTLLWPHPSHSRPPVTLMSSRNGLNLPREVPHFILRVCVSVPPSVPRRTKRLHSPVASPLVQAFALSAWARHPHPRARRFSRGSCFEAAKFASCYGPLTCSPCTGKDFYSRAFACGVTPSRRRV